MSGPIMDRVDIHLNVPAVDINKLMLGKNKLTHEENSDHIKSRINLARNVQQKRFEKHPGVYCNADMKNSHLHQFAALSYSANLLLKQAVNKFGLSARTYFRLIKVSRTIADLAESLDINEDHVAESLQYRIRSE